MSSILVTLSSGRKLCWVELFPPIKLFRISSSKVPTSPRSNGISCLTKISVGCSSTALSKMDLWTKRDRRIGRSSESMCHTQVHKKDASMHSWSHVQDGQHRHQNLYLMSTPEFITDISYKFWYSNFQSSAASCPQYLGAILLFYCKQHHTDMYMLLW